MTVFPIVWHENNLANLRSHLANLKDEVERLEFRVTRIEDDILFRVKQLAEADRRGLTEFDPEKLCRTRKP